MSEAGAAKAERELMDRIVDWFRVMQRDMRLETNVIRLVLLNRRWGRQCRAFGPTIQEVLARDPRFSFQTNSGGGQNVSIRLVSREEAQAERDALEALFS